MTEISNMNLSGERPKLTDWAKEPTVMELKQDFEDARSNHSAQVTIISGWLDNMYMRNAAKPKGDANTSTIAPKLIRKQAEWRYAALSEPFLSRDDMFNVRPVTWEDRDAAQQNTLLLNNQFNNKIHKQKFIDDYVRTAVDEGTVVVKIGWVFREEEYMKDVPKVQLTLVQDPAYIQQLQAWMAMQTNSPSQYDELPDEVKQAVEYSQQTQQPWIGEVIGMDQVKAMRTVENHPTLEVCDYRNTIIDPSCAGDMNKCNFVIHRFEMSMAELKADGRYKNLDRISSENASPLGEPDHASTSNGTQSFEFSDKPRKKMVVYEYWGYRDTDNSGDLRPILAAWVGGTLIRLEDNPFPDKKIPFVTVPYLPVRRDIYGESDGSLLEDNQKIIGAVTRGMIDIMGKSANGQTGIMKGALDTTNRRRFDKGQDYEYNGGTDPRTAIHMHTFPEIPNSAQFMLQAQNFEAESMTGVKAFSNGITGDALGGTATGARGALDAASKRELGILRRLSDGLIQVARKFISMNSEFLSDEEVVRITNDTFVKVRRDDLAGEFDLKLTISTAEEDNAKAQELAFMLQTMGNNMDPELSKMILSDIARLRKMPDMAQKIEAYQPQPDPIAQQKAQLEIALLQAQIQTEQAKAMQLQSSAQLDQVKQGSEQAKAGHLQNKADLDNLKFVEQESGTQQARDLQKISEQARSQAQLKVIEAQLDMQKPQKTV